MSSISDWLRCPVGTKRCQFQVSRFGRYRTGKAMSSVRYCAELCQTIKAQTRGSSSQDTCSSYYTSAGRMWSQPCLLINKQHAGFCNSPEASSGKFVSNLTETTALLTETLTGISSGAKDLSLLGRRRNGQSLTLIRWVDRISDDSTDWLTCPHAREMQWWALILSLRSRSGSSRNSYPCLSKGVLNQYFSWPESSSHGVQSRNLWQWMEPERPNCRWQIKCSSESLNAESCRPCLTQWIYRCYCPEFSAI